MSSTRLPGKILKKLAGREMLWHVVERLKRCRKLQDIVVATSVSKSDDIVEELAKKNGWKVFRGSEENVLSRYLNAAKKFNAETLVRITSDCPLISPKIVDKCIELYFNSGADFTCSSRLAKTFPRGQDVEVFSLEALENAGKNTSTDSEREYVTLYVYHSRPDKFKISILKAEDAFARPELRLTVDTPEDLKMMGEVYSALYEQEEIIPLEKVIEFLDAHPEVKKINADVQQKFVEGHQY